MKKRIKSIFIAKGGTGFPVDEQGKKGTIPFFKVSDTNNEGNEIYLNNSNNYVDENTFKNGIIKEPSIVVPKVGEVLKLNKRRISNPPFLIDNNLMALSLKNKFHNIKFFYYVMLVIDFNKYVNKGSVPSITFGLFSNETIFIPKNINKTVMFLDKKTSLIDKKISLLEKKIELYEEYKKTIIKDNILLGKGKRTRVKDSFEFVKGKNYPIEDAKKNGFLPYLSMDYLRDRVEPFFVDSTNVKKNLIASEGDFALVWDGSNAGEVIQLKQGVVSSTIAIVIPKKPIIKQYMFYFLKSVENTIRSESTGMGIPHVNGNSLKKVVFILPPIKTQEDIVKKLSFKCSKIDKLIELTKKEIELQKEYKKTLINDVVTGKIEV